MLKYNELNKEELDLFNNELNKINNKNMFQLEVSVYNIKYNNSKTLEDKIRLTQNLKLVLSNLNCYPINIPSVKKHIFDDLDKHLYKLNKMFMKEQTYKSIIIDDKFNKNNTDKLDTIKDITFLNNNDYINYIEINNSIMYDNRIGKINNINNKLYELSHMQKTISNSLNLQSETINTIENNIYIGKNNIEKAKNKLYYKSNKKIIICIILFILLFLIIYLIY